MQGSAKSCLPWHVEDVCEAPRMETDLDVCMVRTHHPLASCTKALGVGTACLDPRVSKESRGRRDRRGVQTEHVGVKGSV